MSSSSEKFILENPTTAGEKAITASWLTQKIPACWCFTRTWVITSGTWTTCSGSWKMLPPLRCFLPFLGVVNFTFKTFSWATPKKKPWKARKPAWLYSWKETAFRTFPNHNFSLHARIWCMSSHFPFFASSCVIGIGTSWTCSTGRWNCLVCVTDTGIWTTSSITCQTTGRHPYPPNDQNEILVSGSHLQFQATAK